MNYNVLADELTKDDYKDLDDQAAADLLNAQTLPVVRDIPVVDITAWAAQNGVMESLLIAQATSEPGTMLHAKVSKLLIVLERLPGWRILADDGQATATAQSDIGALMAAGILNETHIAELMAMATTTTSRAAQLGYGSLTAGDVQTARTEVTK